MTREALAQAIALAPPVGPDPPSPDAYITATAEAFRVTVPDLLSQARTRIVTDARHVAMALVSTEALLSLTEIGRLFNRDHTTVLASLNRVEASPQLASYAAFILNSMEDEGA